MGFRLMWFLPSCEGRKVSVFSTAKNVLFMFYSIQAAPSARIRQPSTMILFSNF